MFCFTSDLRGFLLGLCFRSSIGYLFFFERRQDGEARRYATFCWPFAVFVRAVVIGKCVVDLARQIVYVLRWARAAFCWSSAFGIFFLASA